MSLQMPAPSQNGTNDTTSLQSELAHATQEMYKKNVELNERNKTLSLLRKIDVIVLSAVTDPQQVAQQVASVIVEESDFKGLVVYEVNRSRHSMVPLADSYAGAADEERLYAEELSLDFVNFLTTSVNKRSIQVSSSLSDIVQKKILKEELVALQKSASVSTIVALPLIVRNSVIGGIAIMLEEEYKDITQAQKNIIERLTGVIGISIDNALLYREIQSANEKLKEIDKLKDEFVSLASHELRTPMTVIKSYIWLLIQGKTGELSEKQKEYLERTYSSTNRLINMVNDMLNISRIESGRFTIEPKDMDLSALIQEVVAEMQPRAAEQELQLVYVPSQQSLPTVNADSERIKQVLINLVGNSLKFTPKQGTITIYTSVENGYVITHVKDTGRGIKPEDMEKLFKKFNMLGGNYLTKQSGQGTGLGLYLSKSLVELHKGRIWVESEGEYKGSTFSFSLPLQGQKPTEQQAAPVVG